MFNVYNLGVFFLTGPIWGSTVLRIYIRNMVQIHKVKLHLPHIYMVFIKESRQHSKSSSFPAFNRQMHWLWIWKWRRYQNTSFGSSKYFWLSFTTITGRGTRRVKKLLIRFEKRSERLEKPHDQSQKKRRKCFWRSWSGPKEFGAKGLRGSLMILKVLKSLAVL